MVQITSVSLLDASGAAHDDVEPLVEFRFHECVGFDESARALAALPSFAMGAIERVGDVGREPRDDLQMLEQSD